MLSIRDAAIELTHKEPLEKEISVEDIQKIVDANEKLDKELKNGNMEILANRASV